jgi:hypothetical protein
MSKASKGLSVTSMRRYLLLALMAASLIPSASAFAQGRRGGNDDGQEQKDQARRRQRDQDFSEFQAPLPGLANAGPCPYVKVLYDAARYVEFTDKREASSSVGYSGEIESISAACAYKGTEPITIDMIVTFSLGKGPMATGSSKDYHYWVAVTQRNQNVLAKEYFTVHANFPAGKNTVVMTDRLQGLSIPRADDKVSGSNFEVLIGFDVTPEMAQFNRDGKRFRVDAVGTTTAAATPPAASAGAATGR